MKPEQGAASAVGGRSARLDLRTPLDPRVYVRIQYAHERVEQGWKSGVWYDPEVGILQVTTDRSAKLRLPRGATVHGPHSGGM